MGKSTDDQQALRDQAEERIRVLEGLRPATLGPEETRPLVHELHVHQIELEMQNEELRRIQQEQEASRARYVDLYDFAPVGYVTVSESGLILEANLTAASLLGVIWGVLIGQPLTRFVVPEDQDIYYRHRTQVFKTSELQVCELRLLRTDSPPFWARLEAIVTRDGENGPPVSRVMMSDITDRQQAKEALRRSVTMWTSTFDAISDIVCVISSDHRFLEINKAGRDRLGLTREELIGRKCFEVAHGTDAPIAVCPCTAALATGQPAVATHEERGRHYELYAWPMRGQKGEIDAIVHIVKDITDRVKGEQEQVSIQTQLIQAQKMESVGRLAGGVAHDFNNMLGVILGLTEMALDQVDPAQPLHADLAEIQNAAQRSAGLTRQLLAFARKQTVAPRVLNLNEVVEGTLKMLRRLIGEDIEIAWLPGAGLSPIKMDPSQIDQMLANLCVNARDAIADVGKVTIETGQITFDADDCAQHVGSAPGAYAQLVVSDDGCGMDQETQAHLFEPFFTTKVVGKGTGLGLATVYGIVKQNHGYINVYSEPGHGTTFKIYLPTHLGKAAQFQTDGPTAAASRGHETVLLVEDEPAILKLSTRILESLGYLVLAAGSPGEAIRLSEEHAGEIHLLMTDVVMPEMNGRDLARRLLSLYPTIKRLFMSGYTANVIAHRGVLDEGVHFIQKPFSIKGLAAKVREALAGEE